MTIYNSPRDSRYYANKQSDELILQSKMDDWYVSKGWEIVSRQGDYQRDLVIRNSSGHLKKVEEKFRQSDYGDVLIELIQDVVRNQKGWMYSENFDILSYVIHNEQFEITKVYLILWKEFKNWMFKYFEDKKRIMAIFSGKGHGLTMNIAIRWSDIPQKLYRLWDFSSKE